MKMRGIAVDEADEISSTLVEVRMDPELGDEQEVVVLRLLPVDDGELLWSVVPSGWRTDTSTRSRSSA